MSNGKQQLNYEKLLTRSLPCKSAQLATLRRMMTSTAQLHFTPTFELMNFEVALQDDLGKVQVVIDEQYMLLNFRELHAGVSTQVPMVWISTGTDQFVSRYFGEKPKVANAIREILQRPLWHFVSEQGKRITCVFCSRPLEIESSRALGYGPVCAKEWGLYWVSS